MDVFGFPVASSGLVIKSPILRIGVILISRIRISIYGSWRFPPAPGDIVERRCDLIDRKKMNNKDASVAIVIPSMLARARGSLRS
jgi:hypothetical protein